MLYMIIIYKYINPPSLLLKIILLWSKTYYIVTCRTKFNKSRALIKVPIELGLFVSSSKDFQKGCTCIVYRTLNYTYAQITKGYIAWSFQKLTFVIIYAVALIILTRLTFQKLFIQLLTVEKLKTSFFFLIKIFFLLTYFLPFFYYKNEKKYDSSECLILH